MSEALQCSNERSLAASRDHDLREIWVWLASAGNDKDARIPVYRDMWGKSQVKL